MLIDQNQKKRWLCIFDVENSQTAFAKCLQTIDWLEQAENHFDGNENDNLVPCSFYITTAPPDGCLTQRFLLSLEPFNPKQPNYPVAHIVGKQRLLTGLQKQDYIPGFCYYFRIHMSSETDIVDLQYFILLLQTHPSIVARSAVRLMGELETEDWSEDSYFRASHFLRFIQERYPIFYACKNKNIRSLRPLGSLGRIGIQRTFLPLLEINDLLHRELQPQYQLQHTFQDQSFGNLYKCFSIIEDGASTFEKDLFQIGLRMLFDSLNGNRYRTHEKKAELLDYICSLSKAVGGISVLDVVLFGALADTKLFAQYDLNKGACFLSEVQQFSKAVFQILENALYHSELKTGVFSFRIHNHLEYISSHYPGYVVADGERIVELLISDKNTSDNIISNFVGAHKTDSRLKNLSSQISLANFFDQYENPEIKEAWQQSRQDHYELCHGLLTFAHTGYNLGSAMRVRSSTSFTVASGKEFFYHVPGSSSMSTDQETMWIPGTQYAFITGSSHVHNLVDNQAQEDSMPLFDFSQSVYTMTYGELAHALLLHDVYSISVEQLEKQLKLLTETITMGGQQSKDEITGRWRAWFDQQYQLAMSENHIEIDVEPILPTTTIKLPIHFDLEPFCRENMLYEGVMEMFCKGFLSSRFFTQSSLKLYVLVSNISMQFSHVFYAALQAVVQYISFENICVYFYPAEKYREIAPYFGASIYTAAQKLGYSQTLDNKEFPRVFPRDLFCKNAQGYTLFEQEMLQQAEHSLTEQNRQGFKIENTHMRLGNKVHLDAFYEMTLFFENPNYAYYTAFLFLRTLLQKNYFSSAKKILFYGYSSYSRGILWALLQILRAYYLICDGKTGKFDEKPSRDIEYIIYQNDLQLESDQAETQMYYSCPKWQYDHKSIWKPEDTILIQIVPISSSMTTFRKMQMKLREETGKYFIPAVNYTAFWVRDQYKKKHKRFEQPTDEEKSFWQKASETQRKITSDLVTNDTYYLVYATSLWSNPLECKKCFPDDPILEYPLVETDPTSTIPTQQLYLDMPCEEKEECDKSKNDERIANIHGHLLYGHISRGKNHYQYYIRTKRYFQSEHEKVKEWLLGLRRTCNEHQQEDNDKCINVLVIPKQSSNVEFGQYVYEYYFHGAAESIVINTEKEFRSNFIAEYHGLLLRLKDQYRRNYRIRFHYIDTSINSGTTFFRAATLITTCFNEVIGEAVSQNYPFENVFLLISRLSEDSKHNYVREPSKAFHAYAELHISSIRTYGNSCIPCRLQHEAVRYYQNAATKSISAYWEKKSHSRVHIHFDAAKSEFARKLADAEEGYKRMICSHRVNDYIRQAHGRGVADYFAGFRYFFDEMLCALAGTGERPSIYKFMNADEELKWFSAGFKVIGRPFLAFDYKARCAVMDLYLLISEYFLTYSLSGAKKTRRNAFCNCIKKRLEKSDKRYLLDNNNIEWVCAFAERIEKAAGDEKLELVSFVRHDILKGLADLKSNYIMRKSTLIAVFNWLDQLVGNDNNVDISDLLESYARSILRATHSSSDETRSVWLEYLLQNGTEYQSRSQQIEELEWSIPSGMRFWFRQFCDLLLIENNRTLYQSIVEINKTLSQYNEKKEKVSDGLNYSEYVSKIKGILSEYNMRNAKQFLQFSYLIKHDDDEYSKQLYWLWCIYHLLTNTGNEIEQDTNVAERYNKLREALLNIVREPDEQRDLIIFFEKWNGDVHAENVNAGFPPYCVISPRMKPFATKHNDQMERLKRLSENESKWLEELNNKGYYLIQDGKVKEHYQVLLALDNNYLDLQEITYLQHSKQKISPMYIYIGYSVPRKKAISLIRMVLMFRYNWVKWLENDFNNDSIVTLSQHKHLMELLLEDKVSDHQEKDFISCLQYLLTMDDEESVATDVKGYCSDETKILQEAPKPDLLKEGKAWYLLCSYVNSRISRLFRSRIRVASFGDLNLDYDNMNNYYAREYQSIWMKPARNLSELFFDQLVYGNTRRHYLNLILEVIAFEVEDRVEYLGENGEELSKPERMERLKEFLSTFRFVILTRDGKEYAFLAEYLVCILLDCFISALRASEEWYLAMWGSDVFFKLKEKKPSQKCKISICREKGDQQFDYLVIKNKVCFVETKTEPGMSQDAIRWYLQQLWHFVGSPDVEKKQVVFRRDGNMYETKLPILMPLSQDKKGM